RIRPLGPPAAPGTRRTSRGFNPCAWRCASAFGPAYTSNAVTRTSALRLQLGERRRHRRLPLRHRRRTAPAAHALATRRRAEAVVAALPLGCRPGVELHRQRDALAREVHL